MRTKLVGDGCKYCNPKHYIDVLEDQTKDDSAELEKLEETIRQQQAEIDRLKRQRDRLVARFKGKKWNGQVTDAIIAEIEAGK
jgi:uncharacterized coiled-coil protein SlyX